MNSQSTTVRVEQRTVTTAGSSVTFGLSVGKFTVAAILLKIISTVFNIISFAVLYNVRKELIVVAFSLANTVKIMNEKLQDLPGNLEVPVPDNSVVSRAENLSRACDLLVLLCLGFGIVTFLMIVTSFSLKQGFGLTLPSTSFFDIVYHLVAGLLLGGTSLAVLGLQGHYLFSSATNKYAVAGAMALIAAIFHLLHFVVSLVIWKRVQIVH